MALINKVLEGCDGFAIAYMDDILVYSLDEKKTHLKYLQIIFMKLKKARLKINISKCSFHKKHLYYLGHVLTANGILPMREKNTCN